MRWKRGTRTPGVGAVVGDDSDDGRRLDPETVARLRAFTGRVARDPAFTARLRVELMLAHRQGTRRRPRPVRLMRRGGRPLLVAALLAFGGGIAAARALSQSPRTAALERTVPVGQNPALVVMAGGAGRAFVVNQGSYADTSTGGTVSMLDTVTGRVLHTAAVGWAPIDAALDTRTRRVFVVNSYLKNTFNRATGSVSMLDAVSGRVLRTTDVGRLPAAVAVDERAGRVFVLNALNGGVSVLDAASGRVVGAIPLGRHDYPLVLARGTLALDTRRGHGFALIADTAGGTAPVRTGVAMVDTRRGVLLRTLRVGRFAQQVVVDEATGRAFVASSNCGAPNATTVVNLCVGVLDTATGRLIRTITNASSPIVVDQQRGRVFVASGNRVSVIDGRSGRRIARSGPLVAASDTLPQAVDERTGRVLVTCWGPTAGHGSLVILDGVSGGIIRRVGIATAGATAAVDEHTGHVFVLNNGTVSILDTTR